MLRELVGDPEAWDLLWENANVRPVQDLLGVFESSRLFEAVDVLASQREGTGLPPLEPSPAEVALRDALDEERERSARLAQEVEDLGKRIADLQAEHEAFERTVSWRITRPLRMVRRWFPSRADG